MAPLIFYFPYPSIGGVSVLFIRLASILAKIAEVTLIDMPGGYISRNCPPNVRLLTTENFDKISKDSILITQTCAPWRIAQIDNFPSQLRVFFWNLHPNNLEPNLITGKSGLPIAKILRNSSPIVSFSRRSKLKLFLELMLQNDAIAFMDSVNVNVTKQAFGLEFSPNVLQICTGPAGPYTIKKRGNSDLSVLKCVWLGRIEDFKTPILLHLINRLDQINGVPIFLTIIGDGKDLPVIKAAMSGVKNLQYRITGSVSIDSLNDMLIMHDVLFAMGTSALEGAKLGLPTFCLDYSYRAVKKLVRFRLLDEVKGFNLGEEIGPSHYENECTLGIQLNRIIENPEYYSRRSYNYWLCNHSPQTIANRLTYLVARSTLTIEMLNANNLTTPDWGTKLKSYLQKNNAIDGWRYS